VQVKNTASGCEIGIYLGSAVFFTCEAKRRKTPALPATDKSPPTTHIAKLHFMGVRVNFPPTHVKNRTIKAPTQRKKYSTKKATKK
jgi:hypothetical protein